ncbi:hypothetical protein CYMTET_38816 [Cymbomonas tetramitiformis]|uniref:Uncharacterized protein n=1 Tax=Cymbomonas tetramitiformis TaxID=36881 RepID=A0AAE0CBA4_9CHLO|nr:hypothetical protein CYMTET_38816 [Cymbomonas tetramitiformis]
MMFSLNWRPFSVDFSRLFDIFNKGDAAEKKEEAKKEGEGEDEDEDEDEVEDDQEDEIEIHCAQPAAEDPEKKYTTFATKNGFEVMYKLDEDGVQQPAGLEKSDEDNDRLVLWNYSENLLMKAVLTLVRVDQYLPHSQKHLVHVIKKFQVPKQPAEETVDFDMENYRILKRALAPAAALPEPAAEEEAEANAEAGAAAAAAPAAKAKPEAAAAAEEEEEEEEEAEEAEAKAARGNFQPRRGKTRNAGSRARSKTESNNEATRAKKQNGSRSQQQPSQRSKSEAAAAARRRYFYTEESDSETVGQNVLGGKAVDEKETPSPGGALTTKTLQKGMAREVITFKWSGNQEDACDFPKAEEQKAKSAQKTRAKSVSGHKRQREEKVAAEEEKAKQAKMEEHAEKMKYAEKLRLTELKVKQAVLLKEKELRAELAEAERQKEAKKAAKQLAADLKSENDDTVAAAEIELNIHKEIVSGDVDAEEGEEGKSEKILELFHSMAGK